MVNFVKFTIYSVLLLAYVTTVDCTNAQLSSMLNRREAEVNKLHNFALQQYYQRCSALTQCTPTQCDVSYHTRKTSVSYCGTITPETECSTVMGNAPSIALGADRDYCTNFGCPKGKMLNFNEAYVWFPPNPSSPSLLSENICWMHGMNVKYREIDQERQSNGDTRIWTYMGDQQTGIMQMHPGMMGLGPSYRDDNGCKTSVGEYFEPRIRPWYVSAVTGPKDVVLLLDISGSMNAQANAISGETRLQVMIKAAKAVLYTLTQNDFVAIITYSTNVNILNQQTTLLRATNATLYRLRSAVDDLYANGGTWFHRGFQKVREIFSASGAHSGNTETDRSSGCRKIVLFLTDGECTPESCTTHCQQNIECILSGTAPDANGTVSQQNRLDSDVILFTYTMGTSSGQLNSLPRKLACARNGLFLNVPSGNDLYTYMTRYYQYLAAIIGSNNTVTRWSTPYIDGGGLGRMVSLSRPVYSVSYVSGNPHYELLGVVATDVLINTLEQYSNYQNVISNLILRSSQCVNYNISDCTLQQLRKNGIGNGLGTECDATDLKEDGTAYPPLGSESCQSINQTTDHAQQCTTHKTTNDVLCQNINVNTLKPIDGVVDLYEKYICCPGCMDVNTIIYISVGCSVFVIGMITCLVISKKRNKFCWKKKRVKAAIQMAQPPQVHHQRPPLHPNQPVAFVPPVASAPLQINPPPYN